MNAVCFSLDGKKALSGSDDRTVRLWDVETAKQEQLFSGHENAVRAVAFNDKGNWALSGGSDASVRLWQTATGKELGKFAKHTEPIVQVAFLDNGKQTLSGSRDNAQLLWSIEKFYPPAKVDPKQTAPAVEPIQLKPVFKTPIDGAIGKLILGPDRKSLYYFDRGNDRIGRLDTADGKIATSIPAEGIEDVWLTRDGKQLLALTSENKKGTVHFLDPGALEAGLSMPLKFEPRAFLDEKDGRVEIYGEGVKWPGITWLSLANPAGGAPPLKPSSPGSEEERRKTLAARPLAFASDAETKTGYRVTQQSWLSNSNCPTIR